MSRKSNKRFSLSIIISIIILSASSFLFYLMTEQIMIPIIFAVLFSMTYFLLNEFRRHEMISYKIVSVLLFVAFVYISFLLNPSQAILYYLTFIFPVFYAFTLHKRIFYSAFISNIVFQSSLVIYSVHNVEFSNQNIVTNNELVNTITFVVTHIVIIFLFYSLRRKEQEYTLKNSELSETNTKLSSDLYNLYDSKEKTSETNYLFYQYIYNMENSRKYFNELISKIKVESEMSKKQEDDVYDIQRNLQDLLEDYKAKLEEEQKKALYYQKESNKWLLNSNEEIKRLENILQINDENKDSLNNLVDATSTINSLIELIRGISNQINLLALNAAIETSKAGEAGKGFSVIAKEIKHLQIEVLGTLQDIATEMTSIAQYSSNIKDGFAGVEKRTEEILGERHQVKELQELINDFIRNFLINNEVNIQKLSTATSEIESSIKRLNNIINSSNKIQEDLEESDVYTNQQLKNTLELKKIIEELQKSINLTTRPTKHKRE